MHVASGEMVLEPARRKPANFFKLTRLREQVAGSRYNRHTVITGQARRGLFVQRDDLGIEATDNEQCRRPDLFQCGARKIRPATPGNDCGDLVRSFGCCNKGCSSTRAGAKKTQFSPGELAPCCKPAHYPH